MHTDQYHRPVVQEQKYQQIPRQRRVQIVQNDDNVFGKHSEARQLMQEEHQT